MSAQFYQYKSSALQLAENRLSHFNRYYGFSINRVTIKNQRSRWGSCSKKGNLNFNYRIALLPQPLADYVIVHELCHLGEFNHSKKFWQLVAKTIPDHDRIRKLVRAIRL
jgi:predicted metal-dependent hydrolase